MTVYDKVNYSLTRLLQKHNFLDENVIIVLWDERPHIYNSSNYFSIKFEYSNMLDDNEDYKLLFYYKTDLKYEMVFSFYRIEDVDKVENIILSLNRESIIEKIF